MKVAVVKEIKAQENRVALTPAGVDRLVAAGHSVVVEAGAGIGSSQADSAYVRAGATIIEDVEEIWAQAEMVIKVKEPLEEEWPRMRAGQILFTYLHLAADERLTRALIDTGSHCFAYETLELDGALPLLTPMSEVAGRMSIQDGAKCLERHHGGVGTLLGGVPGVAPARVLILGGGVVGTQAARMAAGMGADVTILERDNAVMERLSAYFGASAKVVRSTPTLLAELLKTADMVVGAVLIPGAAAPKLITRPMLKSMQTGSVLVDVAIDQGGCFETSKATTHDNPTYEVDGVVHYCVANMPGAVARTSTYALNAATLTHAKRIARLGWRAALESDPHLRAGLNVCEGHLTYDAVGEALGIETKATQDLLA